MTMFQAQYEEPHASFWSRDNAIRLTILLISSLLLVSFWNESRVDFEKLAKSMPRLSSWIVQMFPPDVSNFAEIASGAFETLAMATIGTIFALVFAFPLSFLAARNTSPHPLVYRLARILLNVSRGTETLVALIFTAAIGFGPFTGVLAIAFHMMGAIGKMFADIIEPADKGPIEAATLTGAGRIRTIRYALLPDILPNFIAVSLYMWEFSVRSSTVLGIVGAGGIGQMLKDTVDLLNFPRMLSILAVVLLMVTAIDLVSDILRRRILHDAGARLTTAPRRLQTMEPNHA
jgi:phosphonate transport system permease protein